MGKYTFEHMNSFNLKHYSQTCLNNLLCKTTNAESTQANPRTIVIAQDNRLSNVNSDHFFWLLKQPLQNLIQWRNAKKNKEQCVKNIFLSDYIYSIANL